MGNGKYTPVFKNVQVHDSSIDELRKTVFIPFNGRATMVKNMEDIKIKKTLNLLRDGKVFPSENYSLPYLEVCLETELVYRQKKNNYIANRILLLFDDHYIRSTIKHYVIQS